MRVTCHFCGDVLPIGEAAVVVKGEVTEGPLMDQDGERGTAPRINFMLAHQSCGGIS